MPTTAPTATSQTAVPAAAPAPAEAVAGTASPGLTPGHHHATSPTPAAGDCGDATEGHAASAAAAAVATGPPPTEVPSPLPMAPAVQASLAPRQGPGAGDQSPTCSEGPGVSAADSVGLTGDHGSQSPVTDQAERDDADDVIAAVLAQAAGRG